MVISLSASAVTHGGQRTARPGVPPVCSSLLSRKAGKYAQFCAMLSNNCQRTKRGLRMLDLRRLSLLRELHRRGTVHAVARALSLRTRRRFRSSSPNSNARRARPCSNARGAACSSRRRASYSSRARAACSTTWNVSSKRSADARDDAAIGTVRLAVFQSAALGIVPQALTLLDRRAPGAAGRDHPARAGERTRRGVGARVRPRDRRAVPGPRRTEAHRARPRAAVPRRATPRHPARQRDRALAEAADHPWVMEPRGTASRHWAEQACRRAGFEPDVRFETADLQAHIRLIEAGHAVALLPDLRVGRPGADRAPPSTCRARLAGCLHEREARIRR